MDVFDIYFRETGSTPLKLAEASGLTKSVVYRLLSGERQARVKHADRIAAGTGGRITSEDALTASAARYRAFRARSSGGILAPAPSPEQAA
jgi:predicted transcriptional regulator